MNRIKKYLLEILLVITCIAAGITLLACGAEKDDDNPAPTTTPTVEATPEPTETPEPTPEPTPEKLEFTTGDLSYFDDALFIGDSRTVGLREYANLGNAKFFATVGMNSFKIFNETAEVEGLGKVTLNQTLASQKFGKVYILLGINEMGCTTESIVEKINALVDAVLQAQPDTLVFLEANMHVTAKRDSTDQTFNNTKINALNAELEKMANGKNIFYIDANEIVDDENGCMKSDYSNDGIHVSGKVYELWTQWFLTKQIVLPGSELPESSESVKTSEPVPSAQA